MNTYELMLMYVPTLEEGDVKKHIENVKSKIKTLGGEVTGEDYWGLRDLAYEIKKHNKAYYTVLTYDLNPLKSNEVSTFLNNETDSVIRHMITILNTGDE